MRVRTDTPPEHPLDAILGSIAAVRLLRQLSDGEAHAPPYLARHTGLSRPSVRDALLRLEAQQIVERVGEGRSVLYRMNASHSLTRRLAKLFRSESKVADKRS